MSLTQQRRLEEKERRREEIIDAAEHVIAVQGYEAAKMEDIAREARVSRALVYTYFRDKIELYFAICERALTLLRGEFERAAAAHQRGYDQVAAIGRAYIAFAARHPTYFMALVRFETHSPDETSAGGTEGAVLAAGRCVHEVIVACLLRGVADGSIRKDLGDPMVMSLTLWSFSHGAIQIAQTKKAVFTQEGIAVGDFLEHAIQMAMRALAPAKSSAGE